MKAFDHGVALKELRKIRRGKPLRADVPEVLALTRRLDIHVDHAQSVIDWEDRRLELLEEIESTKRCLEALSDEGKSHGYHCACDESSLPEEELQEFLTRELKQKRAELRALYKNRNTPVEEVRRGGFREFLEEERRIFSSGI